MAGSHSRVPRCPDDSQTVFQWAAGTTAVPTPAEVAPDPTPTSEAHAAGVPTATPTAAAMGAVSPALLAAKRSLKETVERYLRERGVPYISVDEAKKALFAGAKLRSFHFVVYRPTGTNWLVWAAHLKKESREDLIEWQKIFGDGFVAVVAK